jgi:hypothetical protein
MNVEVTVLRAAALGSVELENRARRLVLDDEDHAPSAGNPLSRFVTVVAISAAAAMARQSLLRRSVSRVAANTSPTDGNPLEDPTRRRVSPPRFQRGGRRK